MVAVRVAPIKPAIVVMHDLDESSVDKLAVKIAESEGIPLVVTLKPIEEIKKSLKDALGVSN
jgi:putative transcriptional regulator